MNNSNNKRNNNSRGKNRRFQGKGRNSNRRRSAKQASTLDPSLLIKKAEPKEQVTYRSDRRIEDLPVNKELIKRLTAKGFERPTEIQDRTLESLLKGRDLLGIAQTGTGKTGAFLMPIIEYLIKQPKTKNHALIIAPTRELALQVADEFKSMTMGLRLYCECFIGGTNINKDIHALRRSGHVIIGTPGRLIDLNKRNVLSFSNFNTLVLDEFDRMLDMGFARDMDHIINNMQSRKQTMLFSATIDPSQEKRIDQILTNPIEVKVSQGDTTADRVDQDIVKLENGQDKFKVLLDLLNQEEFVKVLVFDETKHRVKRLSRKLNSQGIMSDEIQGNKSQNARQKALKSFKEGKVRVLVATDVAARGLDVSDITHVINYQVPRTYDSYIHRIGRTGRAGRAGKAITFVG